METFDFKVCVHVPISNMVLKDPNPLYDQFIADNGIKSLRLIDFYIENNDQKKVFLVMFHFIEQLVLNSSLFDDAYQLLIKGEKKGKFSSAQFEGIGEHNEIEALKMLKQFVKIMNCVSVSAWNSMATFDLQLYKILLQQAEKIVSSKKEEGVSIYDLLSQLFNARITIYQLGTKEEIHCKCEEPAVDLKFLILEGKQLILYTNVAMLEFTSEPSNYLLPNALSVQNSSQISIDISKHSSVTTNKIEDSKRNLVAQSQEIISHIEESKKNVSIIPAQSIETVLPNAENEDKKLIEDKQVKINELNAKIDELENENKMLKNAQIPISNAPYNVLTQSMFLPTEESKGTLPKRRQSLDQSPQTGFIEIITAYENKVEELSNDLYSLEQYFIKIDQYKLYKEAYNFKQIKPKNVASQSLTGVCSMCASNTKIYKLACDNCKYCKVCITKSFNKKLSRCKCKMPLAVDDLNLFKSLATAPK